VPEAGSLRLRLWYALESSPATHAEACLSDGDRLGWPIGLGVAGALFGPH